MKNNGLSITAFVIVIFSIIATLLMIAFADGIRTALIVYIRVPNCVSNGRAPPEFRFRSGAAYVLPRHLARQGV